MPLERSHSTLIYIDKCCCSCAWFVFWHRFKWSAIRISFCILTTHKCAMRNRLHFVGFGNSHFQFIYIYIYVCRVPHHTRSSYSYTFPFCFINIFTQKYQYVFSFSIHPFFATSQDSLIEFLLFYCFIFIKLDTSQMLVHVQFWYMTVRKIVAIVLYCQVLWLPVAIATMYCTLHWCENRAVQIYCISHIWVHHGYSPSKRNCCAKDWVLVLLLMLDQNQMDNKSYCWAPTMVHHCFYDTKAKVTFICGTRRPHSNHRISLKYKKVVIVDYQHKYLLATNDTCGQLKVISMII